MDVQKFRAISPVRNWCSNEAVANEAYWSLGLCIKEAAQYASREEWERSSPVSYTKAVRRGWLAKCLGHVPGPYRRATTPTFWTFEKCCEVSRVYRKRSEFRMANRYAYEKARLMGWLDICCSHMN